MIYEGIYMKGHSQQGVYSGWYMKGYSQQGVINQPGWNSMGRLASCNAMPRRLICKARSSASPPRGRVRGRVDSVK